MARFSRRGPFHQFFGDKFLIPFEVQRAYKVPNLLQLLGWIRDFWYVNLNYCQCRRLALFGNVGTNVFGWWSFVLLLMKKVRWVVSYLFYAS